MHGGRLVRGGFNECLGRGGKQIVQQKPAACASFSASRVVSVHTGRPETTEDLTNTTPITANEQEFTSHKYEQDNNEPLTTTTDIMLEGRRMVNIQYLIDSIKQISRHKQFNCTFSDMSIINEQRLEFCILITLKCKFCNITETLRTECVEKSAELLIVNPTAVSGVISIGGATHSSKNYVEH
ncbi:hypothetical protein PR048_012381 [Dryococelus australis]|uniref:Mutator-like transposase domain-containing protein n=1 Tax=Dryococelus australis TaxID=614101 RepID=A0ABQ9HP88_9NEOP|nr:hypothetical protein PR048_012381 [Dryococelus australis]